MPPVVSQGAPVNGLTTYSVKGHPELTVLAKSWLAAERELKAMFDAANEPRPATAQS